MNLIPRNADMHINSEHSAYTYMWMCVRAYVYVYCVRVHMYV